MKKYKHKATGLIAIHESVGRYLIEDLGVYVNKEFSLNFDFNSNDWEEIKEESKKPFFNPTLMLNPSDKIKPKEEPNYLITAFKENNKSSKFTNHVCKISSNGLFLFSQTVEQMLTGACSVEDDSFIIYSVKNKYGVEFNLKDTVNYELNGKKGKPFIINNFFINRDNILLARDSDSNYATCEDINTICKVKSPIYTTTDGVDIYEGDLVILYLLNKDVSKASRDYVIIREFSSDDKAVAERHLTFNSNVNKAKYIQENTKVPIFVSADGKEMYEGDKYYVPQLDFNNELRGGYLELETDNKTKQSLTIRFSSPELAQEYIDKNKPKYSFLDILNAYNNTCSWATFIHELKKLGK